jgi:PTS system nitrogen regulatory IIA component
MAIGEIIRRDQVVVGLRANDKTQLLRDLAGRAARALSLDGQAIFEALLSREKLGSTGFGKGFALPHARLATVRERFAMFARLARPVEFDAVDGQPVDLVILLLTPDGGGNEHLATLAALARPLRNEQFLHGLRRAPDAEAVHQMLDTA